MWIWLSLKNVIDNVYGCLPAVVIYPGLWILLMRVFPLDMNEYRYYPPAIADLLQKGTKLIPSTWMLVGLQLFCVDDEVIAIVIKPTYLTLNQFWGFVELQTVKSGDEDDCKAL